MIPPHEYECEIELMDEIFLPRVCVHIGQGVVQLWNRTLIGANLDGAFFSWEAVPVHVRVRVRVRGFLLLGGIACTCTC